MDRGKASVSPTRTHLDPARKSGIYSNSNPISIPTFKKCEIDAHYDAGACASLKFNRRTLNGYTSTHIRNSRANFANLNGAGCRQRPRSNFGRTTAWDSCGTRPMAGMGDFLSLWCWWWVLCWCWLCVFGLSCGCWKSVVDSSSVDEGCWNV